MSCDPHQTRTAGTTGPRRATSSPRGAVSLATQNRPVVRVHAGQVTAVTDGTHYRLIYQRGMGPRRKIDRLPYDLADAAACADRHGHAIYARRRDAMQRLLDAVTAQGQAVTP